LRLKITDLFLLCNFFDIYFFDIYLNGIFRKAGETFYGVLLPACFSQLKVRLA